MNQRALALKYRPQVFADLVGQEHVSLVLARALESGRIAHAYLFTGARGVGKTTTARILAKALNCERRAAGKLQGPDPCNACTSCGEITAGVSLDVAEIDGASNRGIADVQALREKVRFSPTGGRYRVVIIDEVHQLSNDAFAALLKTLEEPPPHLVFIFATTDPQKLPDTIRSRTQRFDFARVALRKVADRLLEIARREASDPQGLKFSLTEGAALLIARKSEGSMRDAVSALDQVIAAGETDVNEELVRRVLGLADREAFFGLAGAIIRRDPRGALIALHQAFAKGLDPRDLAEGLSEHLRHLLVLKVDPAAADLVPATAEELERLRAQTEGWSDQDLLRLLRLASEASLPMRDSPQPLVHLEAAVLQMATLEPGETLAQILERLEALEQRLGATGGASAPARGGTTTASAPAGSRGAASRAAPGPGESPVRRSVPSVGPAHGGRGPTEPPRGSRVAIAPAYAAGAETGAATADPPAATLEGALPAATLEGVAPETLESAAPATDERTQERWRAVIEGVNSKKRMLGAFLQESRLVGITSGGIVLAMDDLHRAVVDEKDNRGMLAAEVARVFGRALTIECAPLSAGMTKRRPNEQDLRPMIDRAIAWFEGEIIDPNARPTERTSG